MAEKSPTVYDVADHAGVSIATVSRVFSHPGSVRESTRERVMSSVRELGYVPSASARGLAGSRTGVVGLLLPEHDERDDRDADEASAAGGIAFVDGMAEGRRGSLFRLYYDELLHGFEAAASRAGRALLVSSGSGRTREAAMSDLTGRVDGLAVVASSVPDELIEFAARRVPVVLLAGGARAPHLDRVAVDNAGGMAALTARVIGARRAGPILYLDGPEASPDAEDRRSGFLAAAGSRPDLIVRRADFTSDGGYAATRAVLADARPGAVIAANDQSALGALEALSEAGIRVPDECVVTGFDGIAAGRYSSPALTTIRQPMSALGPAAIEMLLSRIADRSAAARSTLLPVQVLLRETCP